MALKDLTTGTMVSITAAWLDPQRERPLLEGLPRAKALMADVEAAHEALHVYQKNKTAEEVRLAELGAQAAAKDAEHDRKARGLYNVLDGFADLVDDPVLAALARAVRDQVFTAGLTGVNASYSEEAGQASLVDKRLTTDSKQFLAGTTLGDRSLAAWLSSWQGVARELGAIEAQRVKTAGDQAEKPGSAVVRARNQWIRVAYAMMNMIELEKVDDATRRRLLEHLEAAEAKAGRRAGKAKTDAEQETAVGVAGTGQG